MKVLLAQEIVARFYSSKDAEMARLAFEAQFQRGLMPDEMPELSLAAGPIAQILKQSGLTSSTSDALRMIAAGGVRLNGEKVSDRDLVLDAGSIVVLQVGKRRFARVTLV